MCSRTLAFAKRKPSAAAAAAATAAAAAFGFHLGIAYVVFGIGRHPVANRSEVCGGRRQGLRLQTSGEGIIATVFRMPSRKLIDFQFQKTY
jgi:hypothetical protein